MGKFEENIMGLIPRADLLNIGFNVTRQNDPIDGLFGDEKTENILARWSMLSSEYQLPGMAYFHGWDTEARTSIRMPVDTRSIEKGLIKTKINQSERLRELLGKGVDNNDMYEYVLNDAANEVEKVFTRSKVAKNEVMSTGKMTIKENDLDLTIDYGVPATHLSYTIDIAGDIEDQIQKIQDDATELGIAITGMMTSKKVLSSMRRNGYLQKSIRGAAMAGSLLRESELRAYLSEEFDISTIVINDLTYSADDKIGADGRPVREIKRYYPKDKITFYAPNPGGKLGVGLWGDPPEKDDFELRILPSPRPYVYVTQWFEKDPHVMWTKASALFIPVLYNPNSLYIANVTDSSV